MIAKPCATIDDLYRVPGKAELVNGEIIHMPPTGDGPGRSGGAIFVSLFQHERRVGAGRAFPDNVGFRVRLPNRESFCPDVAWHTGARMGMKFVEGAPVFAVEVRSEGDYGPAAERAMAQKRDEYFAAGTQVVWDVDLLGENVIRSYHVESPHAPTLFRRGETANAEPAVPGWTFAVDELFL